MSQGRAAEAARIFEKLAHKSGNAEAWVMLGAIEQGMGHAAEAEQYYRRALAVRPDYPEVHSNIGQLLLQRQAFDEAREHFETTLRALPRFAAAHLGLGRIHLEAGRLEDAERHLEQALQLQQGQEASGLLGVVKTRLGKVAEAEALLKQSLRSGRDSFNANLNLAYLYLRTGRSGQALEHFERAGSIRRDEAQTWLGLARAMTVQCRLDQADTALAKVASLDHTLYSQTFAQETAGPRPNDEVPIQASATALFVRQWMDNLRCCNWENYQLSLDTARNLIGESVDGTTDIGFDAFSALLLPLDPAVQLDIAKRRSRHLAQQVEVLPPDTGHEAQPQRLRIGYLSPDFRRHAVSQVYRDLLYGHDRQAFEIYGYSLWPETDCPVHRDIKRGCDHFVYLDRLSNREAAERIRADGIHILVDLAGYTKYARPEIFAARPAPLQAVYGGYPGSTGAPWIDYKFISHEYLEPGDERHYSEQLVIVKDTHQVVSRLPVPAAQRPPRSRYGLPEEGFLFCSFQGTQKIDPDLFASWMRILEQVQGSYLWLVTDNALARANLRGHAKRLGVDPDRLLFADMVEVAEHIQRQAAADLFLDTRIYSGMTTVSMALWAGLPLLTWTGNNYTSRQGRVALACYGIGEELIASDPRDYEEKAIFLSRNPEKLQDLRDRIAARRETSPLFQTGKTIERVEQAYRTLWRRHLDGLPPASFEIR